jgi:hypothetical protein
MDISNVEVETHTAPSTPTQSKTETAPETVQTLKEAINDVTNDVLQIVTDVDKHKQLYASVKEAFIQRIGGDTELNDFASSDLLQYTKYAMEIIEITTVKGDEQKELVIRLMKDLINESNISYEMKEEALQFIRNGSLSKMIDIVVDATKGKLNINAIQEVAIDNAANCCFAFLRKK